MKLLTGACTLRRKELRPAVRLLLARVRQFCRLALLAVRTVELQVQGLPKRQFLRDCTNTESACQISAYWYCPMSWRVARVSLKSQGASAVQLGQRLQQYAREMAQESSPVKETKRKMSKPALSKLMILLSCVMLKRGTAALSMKMVAMMSTRKMISLRNYTFSRGATQMFFSLWFSEILGSLLSIILSGRQASLSMALSLLLIKPRVLWVRATWAQSLSLEVRVRKVAAMRRQYWRLLRVCALSNWRMMMTSSLRFWQQKQTRQQRQREVRRKMATTATIIQSWQLCVSAISWLNWLCSCTLVALVMRLYCFRQLSSRTYSGPSRLIELFPERVTTDEYTTQKMSIWSYASPLLAEFTTQGGYLAGTLMLPSVSRLIMVGSEESCTSWVVRELILLMQRAGSPILRKSLMQLMAMAMGKRQAASMNCCWTMWVWALPIWLFWRKNMRKMQPKTKMMTMRVMRTIVVNQLQFYEACSSSSLAKILNQEGACSSNFYVSRYDPCCSTCFQFVSITTIIPKKWMMQSVVIQLMQSLNSTAALTLFPCLVTKQVSRTWLASSVSELPLSIMPFTLMSWVGLIQQGCIVFRGIFMISSSLQKVSFSKFLLTFFKSIFPPYILAYITAALSLKNNPSLAYLSLLANLSSPQLLASFFSNSLFLTFQFLRQQAQLRQTNFQYLLAQKYLESCFHFQSIAGSSLKLELICSFQSVMLMVFSSALFQMSALWVQQLAMFQTMQSKCWSRLRIQRNQTLPPNRILLKASACSCIISFSLLVLIFWKSPRLSGLRMSFQRQKLWVEKFPNSAIINSQQSIKVSVVFSVARALQYKHFKQRVMSSSLSFTKGFIPKVPFLLHCITLHLGLRQPRLEWLPSMPTIMFSTSRSELAYSSKKCNLSSYSFRFLCLELGWNCSSFDLQQTIKQMLIKTKAIAHSTKSMV